MQAYIGDYIEMSNVDIPGKTCDVISFSGCDFNCPYCFTPEMLKFNEELLTDIKDIKQKIKNNSNIVDAIIFSGGEPCFQRQALLELARFAKKLGLEVFLHTNGSKPECLISLFKDNLVDSVIFDIKTVSEQVFEKTTKSKTFFKQTEQIMQDIRQSIQLIQEYEIEVEFRTVVVPTLIYRKEDLIAIGKLIEELGPWRLVKFKPGNCLNKKFNAINPPTDIFIENLKEIIGRECKKIKLLLD